VPVFDKSEALQVNQVGGEAGHDSWVDFHAFLERVRISGCPLKNDTSALSAVAAREGISIPRSVKTGKRVGEGRVR
jgi:hypothetical protein